MPFLFQKIENQMKAPAFQLYPQDFISSMDCQTMAPDEFGVYCWLLFHSWIQEPQCHLPNDPEKLSKLLRINPRTFAKMWRNSLEKKFKISNCGNYLYNPRLIKELEKQDVHRKKQAENGKKGGRPGKKENPDETQNKAVGYSGLTQTEPKESSSFSSSSSSSNTTSLHTFSESPYANNLELFKAQFCPIKYQFIDLDYYYNLLKEKGHKYKYENWVEAAKGWMKKDEKRGELQKCEPKPYSPATKAEQDALWGEVNPDFKPKAA